MHTEHSIRRTSYLRLQNVLQGDFAVSRTLLLRPNIEQTVISITVDPFRYNGHFRRVVGLGLGVEPRGPSSQSTVYAEIFLE